MLVFNCVWWCLRQKNNTLHTLNLEFSHLHIQNICLHFKCLSPGVELSWLTQLSLVLSSSNSLSFCLWSVNPLALFSLSLTRVCLVFFYPPSPPLRLLDPVDSDKQGSKYFTALSFLSLLSFPLFPHSSLFFPFLCHGISLFGLLKHEEKWLCVTQIFFIFVPEYGCIKLSSVRFLIGTEFQVKKIFTFLFPLFLNAGGERGRRSGG